jgi:acyl-CoA reductase-like NAD-dependent aldehyde dehydrogenase
MADRIEVLKTYKTYIGGKFPRSESERYYKISNTSGDVIANACRCTRKDIRDAAVAARGAFHGWAGRSAYNRGQILYRIAEMLEGRKDQFVNEFEKTGFKNKAAVTEVESAIDRLIHYAGWSDKYQQIYSTVNPVASSHFNFSIPEPTGIVGIVAPEESPLLGLVSVIAPVIVGGNVCIVLASENNPLVAISFAEVLNDSDLPGGVVNILTGHRNELISHLSSHMDINAVLNTLKNSADRKQMDENASLSVKRLIHKTNTDWSKPESENPYLILDFQEIKTTWHPIGS